MRSAPLKLHNKRHGDRYREASAGERHLGAVDNPPCQAEAIKDRPHPSYEQLLRNTYVRLRTIRPVVCNVSPTLAPSIEGWELGQQSQTAPPVHVVLDVVV